MVGTRVQILEVVYYTIPYLSITDCLCHITDNDIEKARTPPPPSS